MAHSPATRTPRAMSHLRSTPLALINGGGTILGPQPQRDTKPSPPVTCLPYRSPVAAPTRHLLLPGKSRTRPRHRRPHGQHHLILASTALQTESSISPPAMAAAHTSAS